MSKNESRVFVSMGVSVDGCYAGPNESPTNLGGDGWAQLHGWIFGQRVFRERLKFGGGGEEGADNRYLTQIFDRIGANIMGKRMFDAGEHSWPEEAPFHTDVFVLTHEKRASWQRPGGTTFHFVDERIEAVLERARAVAGEKDIRICGGGATVVQYLNAGLVDELMLSVAPTFLGRGKRLFEGIDPKLTLSIAEVIASKNVTHMRYSMTR